MANRARGALHRSLGHLDHLVNGQGIALRIASLDRGSLPGHRDFLAYISDFHVDDLALLIYHFEVIFVNLQHKAKVFHAIVINKVVSRILTVSSFVKQAGSGQGLVRVRLELDVVRTYSDFLLSLVQDDRDLATFNINDLSSFSLVFALSNSHHISWLKIFCHIGDFNLKWFFELGNSHRFEGQVS